MNPQLCREPTCRLLTRHQSGMCAVHRDMVVVLAVKRECVRLLPSEWDRVWMALERQGYHRLAHLLLTERMAKL